MTGCAAKEKDVAKVDRFIWCFDNIFVSQFRNLAGNPFSTLPFGIFNSLTDLENLVKVIHSSAMIDRY